MEGAPVVELLEVHKRYGDVIAVDGVTLAIAPGTCFGLIGPNGAGKTSLLKMIVGFSPLTSGTVRVFGQDVRYHRRAVNRRLGVVPQEGSLDTAVTAFDNLVIYATYFGIARAAARARAEELLAFVQLSEKRDTEIGALSGGMVRRLVLARALINDPELLVLDEPTTGLDPQARHLLWDRVRQLRAEGRSVLLTTHYMDEAERLCDRIAMVDRGRVLAEDTPVALVERFAGGEVAVPQRRANLEDVFLRLAGREIRE